MSPPTGQGTLGFSADFLHGIWLKQAQLSSLSNREWEALVLLLRSEMLLARFAYWYENESEGFPAFVQAHLGNAKTLATRQNIEKNLRPDKDPRGLVSPAVF